MMLMCNYYDVGMLYSLYLDWALFEISVVVVLPILRVYYYVGNATEEMVSWVVVVLLS